MLTFWKKPIDCQSHHHLAMKTSIRLLRASAAEFIRGKELMAQGFAEVNRAAGIQTLRKGVAHRLNGDRLRDDARAWGIIADGLPPQSYYVCPWISMSVTGRVRSLSK
jgi:hypothetical protein